MFATWKQAKKIWGFCELQGNKNTDWARLAKNGSLSHESAAQLVSYITNNQKDEAAEVIRKYIPDFKLSMKKDAPPPERAEDEDGTEKEEQEDDSNDGIELPGFGDEGTGIPGLDEIEREKKKLEEKAEKLKKQAEEARKKMEEEKKKEELRLKKEQEEKEREKKKQEELEQEKNRKPKEIKTKTQGYYKPPIFDEVYAYLKQGLQVLLSGPAGCGKSRMATELALVFGVNPFLFSIAGGMRYAQVFGGTQIVGGKTQWVPSELLKAIQDGVLVCVDEIMSADPEVTNGLNSILERSSRCIQTPIGKIEVHKDCMFMATANTVGRQVSRQYTGAQRTDDSLLDRFITVRMDYDTKVEEHLVNVAKVPTVVGDYLITSLTKMRQKIREHNIPFDPSTRRLITALDAYRAGASMELAFQRAFYETLSPAETSKIKE